MMIHWYLLVGNFVICFWINLVFEIVFQTCLVFDLICLFWVKCLFVMLFQQEVLPNIKFDIWLNIIC